MINKLSKEIYENAKAHGFYEEEKNIGEMLALIHSEVSEALECDRKEKTAIKSWNIEHNIDIESLETQSEKQYFKVEFEVAIKDTFEDELADIMIRVMDLAAYKNIDLERHIKLKMAYNKLRPHKHGKKY